LAIDNPRLTNRLWNGQEGRETDAEKMGHRQPIPIALDTRLNHIKSCLTPRGTAGDLRAQNLVVCCGGDAAPELVDRASAVRLLRCSVRGNGSELDMLDVLQRLRSELGIRTLMVEGGPQVLTSLFQQGLVDAVCITISPKALCGGKSPIFGSRPIDLGPLGPVFVALGQDCVLLSRWPAP
jgi:riboflavin biosynthesis pyrimidine reductase